MKEPLFSVILPVCHGGRFLKAALESAARLNFPPDEHEVIVVADGGDAEARRMCGQISERVGAKFQFVSGDGVSRSALLNAACAAARGRWIAFVDDDCVLAPDWLDRIRDAITRTPEAGLIGGVDELMAGGSDFDEALDWVLHSRVGTGGYRTPSSEHDENYHPKLWNMAASRDLLMAVAAGAGNSRPQVFDESVEVHEDVELAARIRKAGRKVLFAREMRVGHHRDTNFASFIGRNFRMARICRRAGVHYAPHLGLAGVAAATAGIAVLSVFQEPWRLVLAVLIGAYILLLLVSAALSAWSKRRAGVLFLTPFLLAGVHAARTLGFLWPLPAMRKEER